MKTDKITRIIALADSLALPRDEPPDVIRWEETWPYYLEKYLLEHPKKWEVINCARRARTADTLISNDFLEHVIFKRPDIIVIQVGIVDCAPRLFSRREKIILNLRFFPKIIRDFLINSRSRRRTLLIRKNPLAKVYSPPDLFVSSLNNFAKKINNIDWEVQVIVLPIIADSNILEKKSPGHRDNMKLYNNLLESFCHGTNSEWTGPELLLSPAEDNYFCSDGYHLNPTGQRKVAHCLKQHIFDTY